MIKEDESECKELNIVATTQLQAKMTIDGSECGCANEMKIFLHWNVDMRQWIVVPLCNAKINEEDSILLISNACQNIVQFDVLVNEVV